MNKKIWLTMCLAFGLGIVVIGPENWGDFFVLLSGALMAAFFVVVLVGAVVVTWGSRRRKW